MKAHILGNGPSIELYEPAPECDYVVGCNFQSVPVNISVIVDCKPFLVYKGNRSLLPNKKIITSRYAWQSIAEQELEDEFEWIHIIEQLQRYHSSGHIAVDWCLDHDYSEIHLWGFNSIWEDTQETKSDLIIPRSRAQFDLWKHWRERWKNYTQYNIIVHNNKEGTLLKDLL